MEYIKSINKLPTGYKGSENMLKANVIRKYIEIGKSVKYERELQKHFDSIYNGTMTAEYCYTALENGFYSSNPNIGKEVTAYRIGEPRFDNFENEYLPSNNFAENRKEYGVSVCTTKWFSSMKSVFFGIYDDKLKVRGVYKVRGVIIGFGGDDEPLLYLTEQPEKTRIRTADGLKKAVKKLEKLELI